MKEALSSVVLGFVFFTTKMNLCLCHSGSTVDAGLVCKDRDYFILPPVPPITNQDGGHTLGTRGLEITPFSADEQLRGASVSSACNLSNPAIRSLTQLHQQLINRLNDVGLKLGIM